MTGEPLTFEETRKCSKNVQKQALKQVLEKIFWNFWRPNFRSLIYSRKIKTERAIRSNGAMKLNIWSLRMIKVILIRENLENPSPVPQKKILLSRSDPSRKIPSLLHPCVVSETGSCKPRFIHLNRIGVLAYFSQIGFLCISRIKNYKISYIIVSSISGLLQIKIFTSSKKKISWQLTFVFENANLKLS